MATAASTSNTCSTWLPVDDVLLKNAMQEGASLEVLVKGVVPFSRRFTIQELQDRWHALLYDPDVATQASERMSQLEFSGFNPVFKIEQPRSFNFKETQGKRKSGSLRKHYHNMRKKLKFQRDCFKPSEFSLLEETEIHGVHGLQQRDPLCDVLRFQSQQHSTMPIWEPVDEYSAAQLPGKSKRVDVAPGGSNCTVKDSFTYVPTGPSIVASHDGPPVLSNSSVVAEGEDISDSLLNLSNAEDLMLLDVDIQKDCTLKLKNESMVSEIADHTTTTASIKLLDEVQNLYEPVVKGSSRTVSEVNDGRICCVLNTEDLEIPCNDDIFLLIHPSMSSADPPLHISRDIVKQKQNAKGINLLSKGKGMAKDSYRPQKNVPSTIMPEAHLVKPVRFGVKRSDCLDTGALALPPLPRDAKPAFAGPAKCRSLLTNPSISTGRVLNEGLPRDSKAGDNIAAFSEPQSAERVAAKKPFPDPIVNPSASEHEESQSDDDVPYFSDIEAMILEMDLVPFDLDNTTTKQATRYQHESSLRTIMRLEQCVQSCLQRTMARQEAFAVFYGRHSKHYIRKTEVLIGRSTGDIDVDIDLSTEGRANKISRRQAIIRMDGGSFFLKNLGKSVISVNGKSITTGQLLGLVSGCLIELRGMSFVFEINHKYVNHYINGASQGINGNQD